MSTKWLDQAFNNQRILDECVSELKNLAYAFGITGNTMVSEDLACIAKDIEDAAKNIQSAISQGIHEDYQKAQKQVGETLTMVLDHCLNKTEGKE